MIGLKRVYKEETYHSKFILVSKVEEFLESMKPAIDTFKELEKDGYSVEIDIDDEFDGDEFDEGEVTVVKIYLSAYKEVK
jgi:hypothetical protein